MEWSNEQTLRVVEEYERHPVLWDVSCPDHKDRIKKNSAWEEIAQAMDIHISEVQRKIHNLRNQWNAEHQKVKRKSLIALGEAKTKWPYYRALSFIQVSLEAKRAKLILKQDEMAYQRDEELFQQQQQPPPTEISDDFHQASTSFKKIIKKRKPSDEHQYMDSPMDFVQTSTASNDTRDEFSIFADYVASELRTIGDRRALAVAKHNINTVLFEATTGMYDQQIANGHD